MLRLQCDRLCGFTHPRASSPWCQENENAPKVFRVHVDQRLLVEVLELLGGNDLVFDDKGLYQLKTDRDILEPAFMGFHPCREVNHVSTLLDVSVAGFAQKTTQHSSNSIISPIRGEGVTGAL